MHKKLEHVVAVLGGGITYGDLDIVVTHCPVHGHRDNLGVGIAGDGSLSVKCHAGCKSSDVIAELAHRGIDCGPDKPAPTTGTTGYMAHDKPVWFVTGEIGRIDMTRNDIAAQLFTRWSKGLWAAHKSQLGPLARDMSEAALVAADVFCEVRDAWIDPPDDLGATGPLRGTCEQCVFPSEDLRACPKCDKECCLTCRNNDGHCFSCAVGGKSEGDCDE